MKILCTVDGSKESLAVLSALEAFKMTPDLSIELLGVVSGDDSEIYDHSMLDVITATGPGAIFRSSFSPAWHSSERARQGAAAQEVERQKAAAATYLAKAADALNDAGLPTRFRVEVDKQPAEAIIRIAREDQPDIIAMASQGRSGLGALLGESVSSEVLRSGVAPVLLVRPQVD